MDDSITDKQGRPVNAVYGFAHFLLQLLQQSQPTHIAALFDESLSSSFRNKIYPQYKANRDPAPEELKYQFQLCRKLCRAVGIKDMASRRYEADDLIGTLAERHRGKNKQVIIVSRDKDLVQLLRHKDLFWDFAENRQLDQQKASEHFGVQPEQMADFLALAGDSADNIPGVPGVGKKTAQRLLNQFNDLDQLYRDLQQVGGMDMRAAVRTQGLLEQHRDMAYLCRQLSEIKRDVKLQVELSDLEWLPEHKKIQRFFNSIGVGGGLATRFARLLEDREGGLDRT